MRPRFPSKWGRPEQLKSWPTSGQEELPSFTASVLMPVQATGVSFRSKVQSPRSKTGGSSRKVLNPTAAGRPGPPVYGRWVKLLLRPTTFNPPGSHWPETEVDLRLTLVSPDLNSQARPPVARGLCPMKQGRSVQQPLAMCGYWTVEMWLIQIRCVTNVKHVLDLKALET